MASWLPSQSSFSQLGNSGNSAISVKGIHVGLPNVKNVCGKKSFFNRQNLIIRPPGTKCQYCSRFSTNIFINVLFLRGHKIYYYVAKIHMNKIW